jgi:hypothetical protein
VDGAYGLENKGKLMEAQMATLASGYHDMKQHTEQAHLQLADQSTQLQTMQQDLNSRKRCHHYRCYY